MSKHIDLLGTPKTLSEALLLVCLSRLSKSQEKGHAIIRDYLAQKFNVAMLKYPEKTDILMELFEEIVREPGTAPNDEPYHDLSDVPEHYPTEK